MIKLIMPKMIIGWEKWKWNEEYGIYVSNCGNFKDKHKNPIPIKILNANGYVYVKTKYGCRAAHRLVLLTWKPIEDRENFTVDHIDHNKRNNRVDNLEWVTEYENTKRSQQDIIKEQEVAQGSYKIIAATDHRGETVRFKNLEQAVAYVCNLSGITNTKGKETTRKRIESALLSGNKYVQRYWRYE